MQTSTARRIVAVPPPARGISTPSSLDRRLLDCMETCASLEAIDDVGMLHLGLQAVRLDLAEIRRELAWRAGEGV